MSSSLQPILIFFISCLFLAGAVSCRDNSQSTPVAEQQVTVASTAVRQTVAPTKAVIENENKSTATSPPSVTPTAFATSTAMPTAVPTSSPSLTPSATNTSTPTDTPAPAPTATATLLPLPEWLSYLNRFRAMANLPPLTDQEAYTLGSRLHSRYMVGNDEPTAHYELEEKPFYDPAGDQAARNGNLFATSQLDANYLWSINFWVSAPFHLIGILDPTLEVVGYGDYVEAVGETQMAAVLDIGSHPAGTAGEIEYPIMFPGDGSETWVVRHSMFEWPYPFDGCPGFSTPTGPPIVILLGDGSVTPDIISHRFAVGDQLPDTCLFDETSYRNNDPYAEQLGRQILGNSDAVVIMPRNPLGIDQTYSVQVTNGGETYSWSFSTRRGPD